MDILIAEDDATLSRTLTDLVGAWGFRPIVTSNGAEAARILVGPEAPPLAILDWHMPGMEGPEVCRLVRGRGSATPPFLMILTARSGHENLMAGFAAGADDYIVKPFDERELRARIHVGVRMVELRQALAERVRDLEKALAKVRTLQGLLPVCAWCRKVRSDQDYWESFEAYVSDHTDATVTHGICPDCRERMEAEAKLAAEKAAREA
ncbi:MAG: response regulator transcription factor [Deltaproteobacteria bacterium]|jgi:sigma-B regulation protein RsbU (phosphoserine phosphatase)|nr:response regulator transcription factor [Deltaproteobacteria bacterium]